MAEGFDTIYNTSEDDALKPSGWVPPDVKIKNGLSRPKRSYSIGTLN